MLNFSPNFKFSRFFLWGDGVPLRLSASKPWSISIVCKNFRAQHQLRAEIYSQKSPLGCKFIRVNNCLVCGPKYTNFFRPTWEGLWIIKRYADPFRRYSPSKSIVVKNCEKFWTIFCRHKL